MELQRRQQITYEEAKETLSKYEELYIKKHTAWIHSKQGNTYIGFYTYDAITEPLMMYLIKLMELMNVEYSISIPFGNNKKYYFVIEGEDETRAGFIQKFIDNGYKLKWE